MCVATADPKSYASADDGIAAYVVAVQADMRVTVSIAMNACEDTLPQCCLVFFTSSTLLLSSKPSFLLSLFQPSV